MITFFTQICKIQVPDEASKWTSIDILYTFKGCVNSLPPSFLQICYIILLSITLFKVDALPHQRPLCHSNSRLENRLSGFESEFCSETCKIFMMSRNFGACLPKIFSVSYSLCPAISLHSCRLFKELSVLSKRLVTFSLIASYFWLNELFSGIDKSSGLVSSSFWVDIE